MDRSAENAVLTGGLVQFGVLIAVVGLSIAGCLVAYGLMSDFGSKAEWMRALLTGATGVIVFAAGVLLSAEGVLSGVLRYLPEAGGLIVVSAAVLAFTAFASALRDHRQTYHVSQ
ncbi:hypothetical protein [Hoyosella subflava]|uniref:hypothetical protein n=1 Tax=Hoyosella subflava TaxID=639313 RepID=UPI0011D20E07|nr:hypothetical protein [Hoyosella subflava]